MTSELNELLRDHLKEFVVRASPQVIQLPLSVKFFRSNSIQTCYLDVETIKDYPAKHLVWMEHTLRTTGFAIKERVEIADMIQNYCVKHIRRYEQMTNKLNILRIQPIRPFSGRSKRDIVYNQDLILSMKLFNDEIEEGEIREEDN